MEFQVNKYEILIAAKLIYQAIEHKVKNLKPRLHIAKYCTKDKESNLSYVFC